MRHALVIGGTGPTGHFIVNGLIERGFTVSILHTGQHEVDEIPATVTHLHTNPFDDHAVLETLGIHVLRIAMYGRLRALRRSWVVAPSGSSPSVAAQRTGAI
jgi:nucleoside-diphosphate-sugar epimerase